MASLPTQCDTSTEPQHEPVRRKGGWASAAGAEGARVTGVATGTLSDRCHAVSEQRGGGDTVAATTRACPSRDSSMPSAAASAKGPGSRRTLYDGLRNVILRHFLA